MITRAQIAFLRRMRDGSEYIHPGRSAGGVNRTIHRLRRAGLFGDTRITERGLVMVALFDDITTDQMECLARLCAGIKPDWRSSHTFLAYARLAALGYVTEQPYKPTDKGFAKLESFEQINN